MTGAEPAAGPVARRDVAQSVVIDLGEVGREPAPDRGPPPARHPRLWTGLAMAVAMLGLIGASAPPAPSPLVESRVAADLGDIVQVVGDRLYVIGADPSLAGGRPRMIAAYRLPDARLLWRRPTSLGGTIRWMLGAAGRLFVMIESPAGELLTAALDPDTGSVLWQRDGHLSGVVAATGYVLVWRAAARPAGDLGAQVLEAVDAVSGRTVWSHELPGDAVEMIPGEVAAASRSVTALPSGRVEVRDLVTGRVISARAVRTRAVGLSPGEWLQVAGDLVLVTGEPRDSLAAYGLETLELRWTASFDLAGYYVSDRCGDALCLLSERSGLRLVDRGTGGTRWVSDDWQSAEEVGGRLVVFARNPPGGTSIAVLDPATGRRLIDLGMWNSAEPVEAGGRLMLIRHQAGVNRAWVAVFDPPALTVDVLGVVPATHGGCETAPGVVLCRRPDAGVGVWRYP